MNSIEFTPGGIATLACMLEVSAPKPGNVHRGADFEDVTFVDFATSAVVLGEVIQRNVDKSLGETILDAIRQNEQTVGTNTNLGIVLLLVPLAKIAAQHPSSVLTQAMVGEYFSQLSETDGANVFSAIELANPGGLGTANEMDVRSNGDQAVDLLAAMRLASDRDAIAEQYVIGFCDVFDSGVAYLADGKRRFGSLNQAIIYAHVAMMARRADSLILRKCGAETAEHSKYLAAKALDALDSDQVSDDVSDDGLTSESDIELASVPAIETFWDAVGELDFWLRSDGHRRNPGTTADLIAASLFVAIYNGTIKPPFR